MLRLRMVAFLTAAVFLVGPRVSDAAPILFSFSGILGPCQLDPFQPCTAPSGWDGLPVTGTLTFDDTLGTYTQFSFALGGIGNFAWIGPVYPGPPPFPGFTVIVHSASASQLFATEEFVPDLQDFSINLMFSAPLAAGSVSPLSSGYISRDAAGLALKNNFVSGAATSVPEPASILFLGTGIAGLCARRTTRAIGRLRRAPLR